MDTTKIKVLINPVRLFQVVQAFVLLFKIRVKLSRKDNDWLRSKLSVTERKQLEPGEIPPLAVQLSDVVDIAARLHGQWCTCLPRSLALSTMLKARDLNANVHLGVSKDSGSLASHAWVEINGVMISEPESVGRDFEKVLN